MIVWQKAMLAAEETYHLIDKLPKEETLALAYQMRKCAISIPSNIAEGQERNSTPDFIRFLSIAQGSRDELETQLLLAIRIGYLQPEETDAAMLTLHEVGKMINSIVNKLSNK